MDVRLLGPVSVHDRDRTIDLGPAKQRAVLAILAAEANQPVGRDALEQRVWGDGLPTQARKTLHSYLTRLRRVLSDVDGIELLRRDGGYVLAVDPTSVDLLRFRGFVARARQDGEAGTWQLAVSQWRGGAFGGLDVPGLNRLRRELATERELAELERNDAFIAAGRLRELLPELALRCEQRPLDERLAGQLIEVLHGLGRSADALTHYRKVRSTLVERLGREPGRALREVHRRVLADQPDGEEAESAAVPRQLPADTPAFTGREQQLAQVVELLRGNGSASTVVAIDGMGGAGKTALAIRAATAVAERFPDGQLFVDLRGFSGARDSEPSGPDGTIAARGRDAAGTASRGRAPDGVPAAQRPSPAVAPFDALDVLLRSLGVSGKRLPGDVAGRSALLRSELSRRRVLVVLDNAADEAQVVPLLPGTSVSAVIVTGRRRLTGLDDAASVTVEELPSAEAVELFTRVAGRAETDRSVAEIVELCGRLPLAIRIAAARLRSRPNWSAAELRDRLRDERRRLAELRSGHRGVSAAFTMSLLDLDLPVRAAFTGLGLLAGPDFGVGAVAAVTGADEVTAARVLDELVDAHLVRSLPAGRYDLHDLVWLFARERAAAELTEAGRATALARLRGWLLAAAEAAARLAKFSRPAGADGGAETAEAERAGGGTAGPAGRGRPAEQADSGEAGPTGRDDTADLAGGGTAGPTERGRTAELADNGTVPAATDLPALPASTSGTDDVTTGLAWLDAERAAIIAVIRSTATVPDQPLWRLVNSIAQYLLFRGDFAGLADIAETARLAAERDGDRLGAAWTRFRLGSAAQGRSDYPAMLEHTRQALRQLDDAVEPVLRASIHNQLALGYASLGYTTDARTHVNTALDVYRELGGDWGAGILLTAANLAVHQGDLPEALALFREALDPLRRGDTVNLCVVLVNLAAVCTDTGDPAAAEPYFDEARELVAGERLSFATAPLLRQLARARLVRGDHEAAAAKAREALAAARDTGNRGEESAALSVLALAIPDSGEAVGLARQAVAIGEELGDVAARLTALRSLAEAQLLTTDLTAAADTAESGLELAREHARIRAEADLLTVLAAVQLARADKAANATARKALAMHRASGHRPGEARCHRLLAQCMNGAEAREHAAAATALERRIHGLRGWRARRLTTAVPAWVRPPMRKHRSASRTVPSQPRSSADSMSDMNMRKSANAFAPVAVVVDTMRATGTPSRVMTTVSPRETTSGNRANSRDATVADSVRIGSESPMLSVQSRPHCSWLPQLDTIMNLTTLDIDETWLATVLRLSGARTESDAVNLALREYAENHERHNGPADGTVRVGPGVSFT